MLIGTVAGATFAGCGVSSDPTPISANQTYTNNHYVHGVGYYHAPYSRWYPLPYNHYMPGQGYYYGGRWAPQPQTPSITASRPGADAARLAQLQRTSTSRGGSSFGRSSTGSSSTRGGFGSSSHSTAS
ncbi:MAG: hypothetical protein QOF48_3119 [Verrucomicrobiota bacterium]